MRPHRHPSPLPLLDHFRVGALDENSDPSQRLAPPITQLLDSRIYQPRGRVLPFSFLRALPLLHELCRFLHRCCRSPVSCGSPVSTWYHRIPFPSGSSISNQLITCSFFWREKTVPDIPPTQLRSRVSGRRFTSGKRR